MRLIILVFGIAFGLMAYSWASAYSGEFGSQPVPQPISANGAYDHYDIQVHSRNFPWHQMPNSMAAQHGSNCSAPPATHAVQALGDAVYICSDHVMTALDSGDGYAEAVITPSQLLNCSSSCVAQFDISTERMSGRDWWAVTLSPWADNLTLPFADIGADLQGPPRNGLTVSGADGVNLYANGSVSASFQNFTPIGDGIAVGVNQAAVRQTFKLTIAPGHLKFERLASATAQALVFHDVNAPVQMLSDYVVQFEHHSYNPTKDGAGVPATWHWANFVLTPSVPFTLIHATPSLVQTQNSLITFDSPVPTGDSRLRFSAICRVKVDGVLAERQIFGGLPEHFSSYFMPIAAGKQSVNITFEDDGWYQTGFGCAVQDAAVWSKGGTSPSTPIPPTPTSIPPTATSTLVPSSTPTPTAISPTATPPAPTATRTPTATLPTSTPSIQRQCTLRWGNSTIESYGNLTQAECAARGN